MSTFSHISSYEKIVFVAENGQMAIHLPLSAARMGAFSTHTAHPEFVSVVGMIFSRILNYPIQIDNPFLYLTKAEVIQPIVAHHFDMIETTVSCWKASRVFGEKNHCGICVPCLIRRIAIESNDLLFPEYKRDIFVERVGDLPPDDDGKRNLLELFEFVRIFENENISSLEEKYPDLHNDFFDSEKAVAMYKRFASETHRVINRYSNIKGLLA